LTLGDRSIRNIDWLILISCLLLVMFGLITLYSIGYASKLQESEGQAGYYFFNRQLLWVALGLVLMLIAASIPFRYYESAAYLFYIGGIILLVLVLFISRGYATRRWIVLGSFHLQPSELMKIALIFALARFLAEKRNNPNQLKVLFISFFMVGIPFLLVVKEPDLGTALVYPALLIPIMYWRGLSEDTLVFIFTPAISAFLTIYSEKSMAGKSYPYPLLIFFLLILYLAYRRRSEIFKSVFLVTVNLGTMLIVPLLWERLKLYQQRRILAFLRPEADILGAGWQVYQSKVAIGSGGFLGKKLLHGTQKFLAFLPERHSDFIFSVYSEELGFIGALIVLLLFSIIIIRGMYLSTRVKNKFASLATVGICSYFAFHVIINIGMTIGLAPVTGLPLPFMSYGGSSMLVSCFLTGVLLNFSMRFYEY